jgi:hypothetical protein
LLSTGEVTLRARAGAACCGEKRERKLLRALARLALEGLGMDRSKISDVCEWLSGASTPRSAGSHLGEDAPAGEVDDGLERPEPDTPFIVVPVDLRTGRYDADDDARATRRATRVPRPRFVEEAERVNSLAGPDLPDGRLFEGDVGQGSG